MTVFLDTNILLDVLGRREPHYGAAARLWAAAESGAVQAVVSAISFNNIDYVMRRIVGSAKAREAMVGIHAVFGIASLDAAVIGAAISSQLADFEDAIQYISAIRAGAEYLVTRNASDFPKQTLKVVSPEELLAVLDSQRRGEP